jgi:hypothetical protein
VVLTLILTESILALLLVPYVAYRTRPRSPEAQIRDELRQDEDVALAALREVANHNTVQSIKRSILAYLLIRAVRRPRARRHRAVFSALILPIGFAVVRYWHLLPFLSRLFH